MARIARARIVVPGWTGTYWVKHVTRIEARTRPEDSFWMKSAYRIPASRFPVVQRFTSQETAANTPITEMVVNSVITAPAEGDRIGRGQPLTVKGVAWDGGYGITAVEVSADGGQTWRRTTLGADAGRYSFRPWTFTFTPDAAGSLTLIARAANAAGQAQTQTLIQNPAGYNHNLMHAVTVGVA